jgi:glyoxylate reductase
MARPKVYVTRQLPPPAIDMLRERCDVEVFQEPRPVPREVLMEKARQVDGLLCIPGDRVDRELLAAAPQLKVVSSFSVGVDHIDVAEATRRGIYVGHTPGVLTDATADHTWALLLATARRVAEADRFMRARRWKVGWSPTFFFGADVWGATLGIIGLGRIGVAVARRARGFNMRVLYYDVRRPPKEVEEEVGAEYVELDELLARSDFVTVHVPLTDETRGLIGERELRLMKPTAHLVNTARGPIVNQQALYRALKEGWIAGAALDVFDQEPIEPDNPLLELENVVLTPHIASATPTARQRMSELAGRNLLAVLKGEMPPHLYNPEVLKVRPLERVKMI